MSREDEHLKGYWDKIIKEPYGHTIDTKFSSSDNIRFKLKNLDEYQLKLILFKKNLLSNNISDYVDFIFNNLSENEINEEINNSSVIYNKLNNSEEYILMRILFDNGIDFASIKKPYLLNKISKNCYYDKITFEKIFNVKVDMQINDNELINSINKNIFFNQHLKDIFIEYIKNNSYQEEIWKFINSFSQENYILSHLKQDEDISKKKFDDDSENMAKEKSVNDSNNEYIKKYYIIPKYTSPILRIKEKDEDPEEKINKTEIIRKKKYSFFNPKNMPKKPLYLHEQEQYKREFINAVLIRIDELMSNILNLSKNEEDIMSFSGDIDEVDDFIDEHALFSDEIYIKKKELNDSFNEFCDNIEKNKENNLKDLVFNFHDDLFISKLNFIELGKKYPNFYSYLCEDEVFLIANKLIKKNADFSDRFKEILDCFIDENYYRIKNQYNNLIKSFKKKCYIDKKTQIFIESEYEKSIKYMLNLNRLISYFKNFNRLKFKRINITEYIEKFNNNILLNEYNKNKSFFDDFNGYSLDEYQRKIVLSDETTSKIIAGAGSGKTFTLQAKIKYLIDYKDVDEDKILCISFSNAAVNDLKDKINDTLGENNIDIYTFHGLGGKILADNKKMHIPNKYLLHETVESYFEKYILTNKDKIKRIIDFFNIYNYNSKIDENLLFDDNKNKFETLKDKVSLLTDYKSNVKNNYSIEDVKTVDRKHVKSFEELIIANFLFINNIEYIYEDDFFKRKKIVNEEYEQYRPDFYLSKYDIYIEHFGVDKDLNANQLNDSEKEKYKESISWKRNIHKKYDSCLIETYSYENKEGNLLKNLKRKLKDYGVEFSEIDYSRIYERLIKNNKLDDLEKVIDIIVNFIDLFKTNGFHIDDEGNDISDSSFEMILNYIKSDEDYLKSRNMLLLDIIKDIYDYYDKQDDIDFNDMINNPIKLLNSNCDIKNYEYIFVDEYQDTSYSRYRLLKKIVDRTNAKLIVVGDDWQSIFSFSGCQIDLFTNFENYFDYTKEFKILSNYRNSKVLVDLSSTFILENDYQTEKSLVSKNYFPKNPIKLIEYENQRNFSLIFEDIIKEIRHENNHDDILVLGRYNSDFRNIIVPGLFETENFYNYEKALRDDGYLTIKYLEDKNVKIKFRSMHKSKGLEAKNVIVLGLENKEKKGFPSKINDDSLIKYVLNKNDHDTRYYEERRLFYVSLSRTKNNVYLLTPKNNPSEFIVELKQLDKNNKIEYRNYYFNNEDLLRMNSYMHEKFKRIIPFTTKLKCNICGKGNIILKKKGIYKGYFRCDSCDFDYGAFNQSPDLIDTLGYCDVEGCNGLTYIKEEGIKRKICSYYGKTGCNAKTD